MGHQEVLETAARHACAFLDSLDKRSVASVDDVARLRERLTKPLSDHGIDATQVIDELVRDSDGGLVGSAGGRFFGWVQGGGVPAALAADWLVSAWDQNAAMSACSPASAVVEEIAAEWLKELLGLPRQASYAFVVSCQLAHVTCLAAARHAQLQKCGWDVEKQGLFGAPRVRIISSDQRHGTFERAIRFLGFGSANAEYLPADANSRLPAEALERALSTSGAPAILLLQAGEINTGAFDCFAELIPIAHQYGAWVHVDGAFGMWAAASPQFRHLVAGIEQADSWATDGHKWLNVPYDSGFAFVAHPEPHRASMMQHSAYLVRGAEMRDQMHWNPDSSRRARGFAVYAAIRELGRGGIAAMVDRCCEHARSIVEGIGRLGGAEALWTPIINQGLVRFLDPEGDDHDRRTEEVMAAINKSGEAFFTGTTWRGMRAVRVSVSNWRTSESDVRRTVEAVRVALGGRS